MVKYLILIGWLFLWGGEAWGQQDSTGVPDTAERPRPRPRRVPAPRPVAAAADSLRRDSLGLAVDTAAFRDTTHYLPPFRRDTIWLAASANWQAPAARYQGQPYFSFTNPTRYTVSVRAWTGKEAIFYCIVGLLILFALIKNGFYRYIRDLYKTYFRTTIRQRQIKEQLLQSPLPSLLLNAFFLLSTGLFVALVFEYFRLGEQYAFWVLYAYSVLALLVIYAVKFVVLKFIGWILQASDVTDTYIFVVFTTNKIIGVSLLPFTILLAFSYGLLHFAALNLGIGLVAALFVYRYFLSYVSVHRQVRVSFLHFLLYLAAFEIAPLLLINKLLFTILS